MALSDVVLSKVGRENIRPGSTLARVHRGRGVQRTGEFARIKALPRRTYDDATIEEAMAVLTEEYKTPDGEWSLWPLQALALLEIFEVRGGFFPIVVGGGKALLSLLAAVVLGLSRVLLFVPPNLRPQTKRVIEEMREHWRLPDEIFVRGYSELGVASGATMIEDINPQVIVLDECHNLKNLKSARGKRFRRFVDDNPQVPIIAMSGTVTTRSIMDYAHVLRWCLGERLCPLPNHFPELLDWSRALDEGVPEPDQMPPGVLVELCEEGETVREGYRRRLTETPGVIASGADELGTSLVLCAVKPEVPARLTAMVEKARNLWEDPNGDPLLLAVDLWRLVRQLSLGFWYRWEPSPPKDWLAARREWRKYVGHILRYNKRQLDSELQVWNDCARMEDPPTEWRDWNDVKDTFKINTVAQWESDHALNYCARWLKNNEGIAWVEHTAFGEALSHLTGLRYYGAGTKASAEILDATGPIIASYRAHGTGKNLQQWCNNLVVSPPSNGKIWEQLLGRTHRHGQKSDVVTFDVYMPFVEGEESLRKACADARWLEETLGSRQRLCYCDFVGVDLHSAGRRHEEPATAG